MKTGRKLTVLFLSFMLAAVTLLAGCGGGSKTDYSALQQDVVIGRNIFVSGGETPVVFFGYNNLLCSALFKDGEVYDFVVEAGFTGDVYALAVYDGMLYVSASDGIFKYDLEMFSGSGAASPEVLWDNNVSRFNQFQIYDGKMFFLYGVTLCYLPIEGGAKVDLATEVGDFEVTSNGIYYSKKDGSLHLLSTDFSSDEAIGEVSPGAVMCLGNGGLYYKQSGVIKCFSLDKGEVSDVETAAVVNEFSYPWVNGVGLVYNDEDYNLRLISGGSEKECGNMVEYPDKHNGFIFGDWIVSQSTYYREINVIDCTNGIVRNYQLEKEMADDLSKISGGSADTGTSGGSTAGTGTSGGTSGSGSIADYNIMDGFMKNASADGTVAYMYFNDFMLIMPNNDKWSMEEGKDYVTIYLWSAQQEGYGGRLVTIHAYDLNDNSYEMLPSYHVAGVGKNAGVRFIAEYPTDVQWNGQDAQQDADYRELQEYLQKIGEGAVNSPLQTADSD